MKCAYLGGCSNDAAFVCVCEGEGTSEERKFCAPHTVRATEICELFGWTLTATRIDDGEALVS